VVTPDPAVTGGDEEPASPILKRTCADGYRARLAAIPAVALPLLAIAFMLFTGPPGGWVAAVAVAVLVGLNVYSVVYVALTWRVFRSVDADEFARRMEARTRLRRPLMRRLLPGGDGPSFAVSAALVAFAVVVVMPHINAIQLDDWLLVPISMTILFSSWAVSVTSYALHYAQLDLAEAALDYPGTRERTFSEYAYFSVAVATTLGTTDVTATTPQMRHAVTFNVVVAFAFNSVIVALLVSILIR
jgi:uncharacterized membrane protein